jgi:hypothetical protein
MRPVFYCEARSPTELGSASFHGCRTVIELDTLKQMQRGSSKHRAAPFVAAALAFGLLLEPSTMLGAPWKEKTPPPTLRWAEGQPGCTFSRDDDGKYRYALWTPDYGVILAVDSQELEKVHHRVELFFGVQMTVRYRGKGALAVSPGAASLEFVRHFKVVQASLDPESFAQKTQDDADDLEHETQREIEKNPGKKEEREQFLQIYQKEVAEFLEFLSKHTLMAGSVDPSNPEMSGWVLFSTHSKWIGNWKKPEEFVLRLPLDNRIVEFPFALPPAQGDLILRKR